MSLKIIKTKAKRPFCIFCKKKLIGNRFLEINTNLMKGNKKRWIYQIHLSCGYNFIKQLHKPTAEDKKMFNLLEKRYKKEMIVESLEKE